MERTIKNDYSTIKQSIVNIINRTKESKNFNLADFFGQMENSFQKAGFREVQKSGVKNILVMRLDAIGDFVLSSGFIRELRLNYPFARITLVVSKLVYPLAELCPYVNRVLAFDNKFNSGDITEMLDRLSNFAEENLWKDHYDLAFSIQWGSENLPPLFMGYLSGARERIGYGYQIELLHFDKLPPKNQDPNYMFLTKPVINPKGMLQEAEKHLYILESVGLPVRSKNMELWYSLEDLQNARALLGNINEDSTKIVVGIGAGGDSRKYSIDNYIKAFKMMVERTKGKLCFVIIGGKAEAEDAKKIQSALPTNCVLNLVEKTTLRETIGVISLADIFIGNDTGVMHMAAALNIPIIAVYRQPKDRDQIVPGVFNEYYRFAPWQAMSIVLRPDHALGECKNAVVYGGCKEANAHCINQVKPKEIAEAFNTLTYMLDHNLSIK